MPEEADSSRKFVQTLLKRKDFRDGWAKAQEALAKAASEDLPTILAGTEEQQERLHLAGFPTDNDWLQSLVHLADIVEVDPVGLSADDIERKARAWLDREKIRAKLRHEASRPPTDQVEPESSTSFLPEELCIALRISKPTLNKYARAGGVATPGRGQRNHRYSWNDREAICRHIIANVSEKKIRTKASEILAETKTKSKDKN